MTDHTRAAALLDRHATRTAGADGDSLAAAVERHRRQVASDQTSEPDASVTSLGDRVDADAAISALAACREDLDLLLGCVPVSRRSTRFNMAVTSLDRRIKCGEELMEACRGR
jgi:hypothetical protein